MNPHLFQAFVWAVLISLSIPCSAQETQDKQKKIPEPYRTFIPEAQKRMAEFPELPVTEAKGKERFFSVPFEKSVVTVGEHRFACFRFTTPAKSARDLVWAFAAPPEWAQWYILPAAGTMEGFHDLIKADRLYEGLPATVENPAILQSLEAASLKPSTPYIIWFKQQEPAKAELELKGIIRFLPPPARDKPWDSEEIEKALQLKSAPPAEQAKYLHSRGATALLDARFFEPGYGRARIDSILMERRHSIETADGFFIAMKSSVPPCKTEPLLADVQAAYGQPDLILNPAERHLFEQEALGKLSVYYYDYIGFVVDAQAAEPRILNVVTQGKNAAELKPNQDGYTWSDSPMREMDLRVFYHDRKEIARVAFWGKEKAELLSGTFPKETFSRSQGGQREELKYLGDASWEYRGLYSDGVAARVGKLKNHAWDELLTDFYPDGKKKAEVPYSHGVIEGMLKQWRPTGESREQRFRKGEPVDE